MKKYMKIRTLEPQLAHAGVSKFQIRHNWTDLRSPTRAQTATNKNIQF